MTDTSISGAEAPDSPEKPDITADSQARVAQLETEIAQMKDKALRAMAEAENIRKRAQKDVEEGTKYAVTGFARDLVAVAENLHRALISMPEEAYAGPAKSLADGVEMTLKQLMSAFERQGIRRIDPIHQKFDPNYHQAMLQLEVPDAEAGTVVQVLEAGYTLHDRLLRPALVGVAKGAAAEAPRVDATA